MKNISIPKRAALLAVILLCGLFSSSVFGGAAIVSISEINNSPRTFRLTIGQTAGFTQYEIDRSFDLTSGTWSSIGTVTGNGGNVTFDDTTVGSAPTAFYRLVSPEVTPTLIPRGGWTVTQVDSQETIALNGAAANVFDGNVNTLWHTQFSNFTPYPPHEIQINLGATYNVSGFRYLPRQDKLPLGRIGQYEFYVSLDGSNWGTPVAIGTFPNTPFEQQVLFPPKVGRFIRMRAIMEVYELPWTAVAELNALQTATAPNQAPSADIGSPAGDVTIVEGSQINFTASGIDPDGNAPLSYYWSLGASSGIIDSGLQNPGLVRFTIPGTYTVTLTVADAWGAATQTTRVINVLGGTPIPSTLWTLRSVDSQELPHIGVSAFDGNPNTYWQSQQTPSAPLPPHEIQIDLGASYRISGFVYLPRQDGNPNGRIGVYLFYISADGTNWGSPVAGGSFANDAQQKQIPCDPTYGRYVRLQAITEVNGGNFISVAELGALQAPITTITPSVRLLQPKSSYLQTSSNLDVVADAGLSGGQGVRLMIDGGTATGGAQFDDFSPPYEVTFSGIDAAPHTVDAVVIDSLGNVVDGVAARDEATQVGIGDYQVAAGDSITYGDADDIPSDDTSQDGRVTGGGFEPILADLLRGAVGRPQLIVDEGIPGLASAEGVWQVAIALPRHPYASRFLVMYGTNDREASGAGLSPGDSGYAGTYKDNMQRIVDEIRSAGKDVALAKLPVVLNGQGIDPQREAGIQAYNQVIDELVANPANNITLVPPDFHTYFANHYSTEFADWVHPNGLGYQSMANLWFGVLPHP